MFDHSVEKLFSEPQPVTEAIRRQAIEYLEMMDDGGGPNLARALEQALASASERRADRASSCFSPTGNPTCRRCSTAMQNDKRDVRVFTVGFGDDVNRALLVAPGGEQAREFTYIAAAANIEREVSLLYRQIDAPVLVDVSLEASGGAVSRALPADAARPVRGRRDSHQRAPARVGPVTLTIKGKQGGRRCRDR